MRIEQLNGARSIAIIAVVAAEVIRRIDDAGFLQDGGIAHALTLLQYAANAVGFPMLFVLAGMEAASSAGQSRWASLRSMLLTIVYPYVVWSVLQFGALWVLGTLMNEPFPAGDIVRAAWEPSGQLWFLYALFVCALFGLLCIRRSSSERLNHAESRHSARRTRLLPALALIAIGLVVAMRTEWGIVTMTCWGLSFYMTGMLLSPTIDAWTSRTRARLVVLAALLVFAAASFVGHRYADYLDWRALPASVSGIVAILALAGFIATRRSMRWVAAFGAAWRPIYLMHVAATAVVWTTLSMAGIGTPLVQAALGIVVGIALPYEAYLVLRRIHLSTLLGFEVKPAITDVARGADEADVGHLGTVR